MEQIRYNRSFRRDPERIDRLSGIVTISSVRAYPSGDHPDGISPVHIKKHPDTGQKVSSDTDMIISEILNPGEHVRKFNEVIRALCFYSEYCFKGYVP